MTINSDPDCVDAAELGSWLDLSARGVRDLAQREIIVRAGKGRYPLKASIVAYTNHLRSVAAGRGPASGASGLDLVTERARLAKEQADAQAMKNELTRGSTVLVSDVVQVCGASCARIRTRLLAIPSTWAPKIFGSKTPTIIFDMLTTAVVEALEELSGYYTESTGGDDR